VRITKAVVFFTTNPTKLVLRFSEFSTNFYAFYKFLQKVSSLLKIQFAPEPLEKLNTSQIYPWITVSTQEKLGPSNLVPGADVRRARRNSGGSGGAPGRGRLGVEHVLT
jgi:hypothetical protein